MKILYATDLDRTLIYSHRFLKEHPTKSPYTLVEKKDNKEISYISNNVKNKIIDINNNDHIEVVPVTTRSLEEFSRLNLGFKTKYAIVSNGGIILENGEPMKEWEEYIKNNTDKIELMRCAIDISELASIHRDSKFIDNRYVFNKTTNTLLYDVEVVNLINKYPNINFVRQKRKIYAIPKCFSKAIALRWLQLRLECDKLVASGDSELDLPMLAIADYAIVPEHGDLIKQKYVTDGRIVKGGIDSPLQTFNIIEGLLVNN